jgi:shikimate kinase
LHVSPDDALVAPRHVLLVGGTGVGKTTVGRLLANTLGRSFVDSDTLIEARAERTVREIFAHQGEEAFRALERDVLHALAHDLVTPHVIALGGGAPEKGGDAYDALAARSHVIWLRARPETVLARLGASGVARRPMLAACDPLVRLAALLAARESYYARGSTAYDTDDATPAALAQRIAREVRNASDR